MIYDMHILDEMKQYVGLTSEDDTLLARFGQSIGEQVVSVVDHFYERILSTPSARAVLQDDAQVVRLKVTLARWLEELLAGPRDVAYYERRRKIGHKHVQVGLPSRFMFTAMSVFYQDLCLIARDQHDADEAFAICTALRRATDLDLAIMTGTYVEGRELKQLASLQELILTRLPIAAIITDKQGRVSSATGPASAMVRASDVVGKHWTDAFPPQLLEDANLRAVVAQALLTSNQRVLPRIKTRIRGRRHYFRITVVPLDHAQAALLIHLEDLSDAIDAEARVQQSETLAQIGTLSAAIAHELRNPLAGMSGAIQVISRSFDDKDSRKGILAKVDQQIGRLNQLVTELLTFARPA